MHCCCLTRSRPAQRIPDEEWPEPLRRSRTRITLAGPIQDPLTQCIDYSERVEAVPSFRSIHRKRWRNKLPTIYEGEEWEGEKRANLNENISDSRIDESEDVLTRCLPMKWFRSLRKRWRNFCHRTSSTSINVTSQRDDEPFPSVRQATSTPRSNRATTRGTTPPVVGIISRLSTQGSAPLLITWVEPDQMVGASDREIRMRLQNRLLANLINRERARRTERLQRRSSSYGEIIK